MGVFAGLAIRPSCPHRTGVTRLPPALVVDTTVNNLRYLQVPCFCCNLGSSLLPTSQTTSSANIYSVPSSLSYFLIKIPVGNYHRHSHINESCTLGADAPCAGHQHSQPSTCEPHWHLELVCRRQQPLQSSIAKPPAASEITLCPARQTSSLDRPAVVDGTVCLIFTPAAQALHLYPLSLGAPALGFVGCLQEPAVEHACQAHYLQAVQRG